MALIREHQPPRDAHLAVVTLPAEGAPGFVSAEDDAAEAMPSQPECTTIYICQSENSCHFTLDS